MGTARSCGTATTRKASHRCAEGIYLTSGTRAKYSFRSPLAPRQDAQIAKPLHGRAVAQKQQVKQWNDSGGDCIAGFVSAPARLLNPCNGPERRLRRFERQPQRTKARAIQRRRLLSGERGQCRGLQMHRGGQSGVFRCSLPRGSRAGHLGEACKPGRAPRGGSWLTVWQSIRDARPHGWQQAHDPFHVIGWAF